MLSLKYVVLLIITSIVVMCIIQAIRITIYSGKINPERGNFIKFFLFVLTPPLGNNLFQHIVAPIMFYGSLCTGKILSCIKAMEGRIVPVAVKVEDEDDVELTVRVIGEFMLPCLVEIMISKTSDQSEYDRCLSIVIEELKRAKEEHDYASGLLVDVERYSKHVGVKTDDVITILIKQLPLVDSSAVGRLIEFRKSS